MLQRDDLGKILYETRTRVKDLEIRPILDVEKLTIYDTINFKNVKPNTYAYFDNGQNLTSQKLTGIITGTTEQIIVQENQDNTITLSTPQDIGLTSEPIFGGLTIGGNIDVTGTVDGVDVSILNMEYNEHIINNTDAHFGQNLSIHGEPMFTTLLVIGTVESTNVSTGTVVVNGGMGIKNDTHIGGNLYVTKSITANEDITINGKIKIGKLDIIGTDNATSNSTGSMTILGGLGVQKDLYAKSVTSETIFLTSQTNATSLTTGTLTINGGASINKDLHIGGNIIGYLTTNSTDTKTGSVIFGGGVSVAKNLSIGGDLRINGSITYNTGSYSSTVDSTDKTTGAVTIVGGLGVNKNITSNTMTIIGNRQSLSTNSGTLIVYGGAGISLDTQIGGKLYVHNTSDATNTLTGSIMTDGGLSVNKSVHIGERLTISSTHNASSVTTGTLIIGGGVGINKNLYVGGNISVNGSMIYESTIIKGTINATDSQTGTLIVNGGVGINKNLYVGGNLNVNGSFVFDSATIMSTTNSTSISTGSLIINGGLGVQNDIYVGHNINTSKITIRETEDTTDDNTGSLIVNGGSNIKKNIMCGGKIIVKSTEESINSSTGALIVNGGLSVLKNVNISGELYAHTLRSEENIRISDNYSHNVIKYDNPIKIKFGESEIIYNTTIKNTKKIIITIFGYDITGIYTCVCETTYIFAIESSVVSLNGLNGNQTNIYWTHKDNGWVFDSDIYTFTVSNDSVYIMFNNSGTKQEDIYIRTIEIQEINV